jgi:hypothetical protein
VLAISAGWFGVTGQAQSDYFSRHPHRIVGALMDGELDYHGFALVSFFVSVLDHGKRTRHVSYTLAALSDIVGWPLGVEALRRHLHDLREKGWIRFEDVSPGQRRPWRFYLGTAAIDATSHAASPESPPDLNSSTGSQVEVTSTKSFFDSIAIPHSWPRGEQPEAPPTFTPREENENEMKKQDPSGPAYADRDLSRDLDPEQDDVHRDEIKVEDLTDWEAGDV